MRTATWFRVVTGLLVGLFLAGRPAPAQVQTSLNARFDSGVVKLGGVVQLIVEVAGAKSAEIKALPDVPDLRFGAIERPRLEEQFTIVNGRQSSSRKLTWYIAAKPERKGDYTIPPITVQVDGRDLATRELRLKVVEDMKGEELGFFEISAPASVVEGQAFWLEMRFGFDAALNGKLNHYNLSLPWLDSLAGLVEIDSPGVPKDSSAGQIYLNSRSVIDIEGLGQQRIGTTTFLMLRVKKRFVATSAGKLSLPTSHFEFGFRDSAPQFFRTREDVIYFKRFPAFDVTVQPLPEEGRTFDFSGGVGTIRANATADRVDVDAGDSIKLLVDWTGEANLQFLTPPDLARLEAFKGFRVYGSNDRKTIDRRSVTYDIAPISPDVTSIPPVPLNYFDTEKQSYRTVETSSIPIRVRALSKSSNLGPETPASGAAVDIRDLKTRAEDGAEPSRPGTRAVVWGASLVVLGWLVARTHVRRRGDPDAPRARARRGARRAFERALSNARTAGEQGRALAAFLAARTGETPEAWAGRDPREWWAAMRAAEPDGAPRLADEDARVWAALTARLDERKWAGKDDPIDGRELLQLADRLVGKGL